MSNSRGIIAFCENPKCGAIFEFRGFVGGGSIQLQFENSTVGPCPVCGSQGKVPDGLYNYINQVVDFVSGPKESVEKLQQVKQLLEQFKQHPGSREEVLKEVDKVSPELKSMLEKAPLVANQIAWINLALVLIGLIYGFAKDSNTPDKDTLNEKMLDFILNQNKSQQEEIKRLKQPPPVFQDPSPYRENITKKLGRNEKCYCGSGKKYKVCHGR